MAGSVVVPDLEITFTEMSRSATSSSRSSRYFPLMFCPAKKIWGHWRTSLLSTL